jgi:hypothetical protein
LNIIGILAVAQTEIKSEASPAQQQAAKTPASNIFDAIPAMANPSAPALLVLEALAWLIVLAIILCRS